MRFTQTLVFAARLAPLDAEESELCALIDQLAGTIERKKAANAVATKKKDLQKFRSDEIRMEAAQKKLVEVRAKKVELLSGESLTHYEICQIRAEMKGTTWTPEAAATLSLPRAQHEGWGEKAVRIMRGLPPAVTQGSRDMEDGDAKKLDSGRGGLQTAQVGTCGSYAWGKFWDLMTPQEKAKRSPELVEAMRWGELTQEIIKSSISESLLEKLMDVMLPSEVISHYGDIYAVFNFGYVVIPQGDADDAWTLVSITKGRPRYALRRAYSLQKMLEESA